MRQYMYVFVRRDLSLPQQIVQASHASAKIGEDYHSDTNIVLFDSTNELSLKETADYLKHNEIKFNMFYEPDVDEFTSIATEPLLGDKRKLLNKFRLYK